MLQSWTRRLRILEAGRGEDGTWTMLRDDEPLARLSNRTGLPLDWGFYTITLLTSDPDLRTRLLSPDFWDADVFREITWRNDEFNENAPCVIPASRPFDDAGRLVLRGLFLRYAEPNPIERVVLWFRRLLGVPRVAEQRLS